MFFYRDRTFCIPPWEEEKFYKDSDVTEELIKFIEGELLCLGVSPAMAKLFSDYVLGNTVVGAQEAKYYNNGLLFLTSSLNLPPNKSAIIESYDKDKYSFFPLWNGKSSFFDVDVSTGNFDSTFLRKNVGAYLDNYFFYVFKVSHLQFAIFRQFFMCEFFCIGAGIVSYDLAGT